eukprot:s2271_g3.t3
MATSHGSSHHGEVMSRDVLLARRALRMLQLCIHRQAGILGEGTVAIEAMSPLGGEKLISARPSSSLATSSTGNLDLYYQRWRSDRRQHVRAVVFVHSGETEHAAWYNALAVRLAAVGCLMRAQRALAVGKGDARFGGDSSAVRDQLKNVQQIQAAEKAFAAILGDGSAFPAILGDGSVVTWGCAGFGGDSRAVRDQLRNNVQQVQATRHSFAATLGDVSVVTWADASFGGDSSAVRHQLKKVQQIQATRHAFDAIRRDGYVVTWGGADFGGDSSAVRVQLNNVQQIQASCLAFAAIVTWGGAAAGGGSSAVRDQLTNVQQLQATRCAFAAILGDGSVVTWGQADRGGDSSAVRDQLKNF